MSGTPPDVWRAAKENPPTESDFLSYKALGIPQLKADTLRWEGVSTFDDLRAAAKTARQFHQGDYLARLTPDPDGPVRWTKTGRHHHWTLSGTPAEMLARVAEVIPLASVAKGAEQ